MVCNVATTHTAPHALWDDDIAALELQLGEIRLHDEGSKGKYLEDRLPDNELAFLAFHVEIQNYIDCLNDRKFAHSIAHALDVDAQAIADITQGETEVHQDRELALQLNAESNPEASSSPHISLDRERFSQSECHPWTPSAFNDVKDDQEAGPSWTFSSPQERAPGTVLQGHCRCCVCLEDVPSRDVFRMQCEDPYCRDCLKSLFIRSTRDEGIFPPKCCGNLIPLDLIAESMSTEELQAFQLAELEFGTADRTYCSQNNCGRFIAPERITAGMAECGHCGGLTCSTCKGKFHVASDCPRDAALQATLALARAEGWQRCYRCKAMVELSTGCYHMKCKCKAQFCYLCGTKWKNCRCEQWDDRHLLDRAEVVVDREAPIPLPGEERQARILQVQDELVEFHECEHSRRFQRIFYGGRRGFTCEMCEARHWKYILQCRRCHVRVCEDCRRHRI